MYWYKNFSLLKGTYNTLASFATGQTIEEKANKNTQIPIGTKTHSLKSGAVVCYYCRSDNVYNNENQHMDLRPASKETKRIKEVK